MNLYFDCRILQAPCWSGEHRYVYNILKAMVARAPQHAFHLHFGWTGWDERLDELVNRPNVIRHMRRGTIWSHLSVSLGVLATGSRVFYRMYNDAVPLRAPVTCPVAVLIHDNVRHVCPECYSIPDPAQERAKTARSLRQFELVFTVSETVKRELIDLFAVPAERIVVGHNAVDAPHDDEPDARPPAVPDGAPFFLMVNPGRAHKNWQVVLAAFADYIRRHDTDPAMRLVLAGDVRTEQQTIEGVLNANPALAARVILPGFVSDEELRYLYRQARLMLMPSRYEGFGVPALEAMAYGVPLVASDILSLREVTGGPETGAALHVGVDNRHAWEQAMIDLGQRSNRTDAMIRRGRERARCFSWDHSASMTLDALIALGGGRIRSIIRPKQIQHEAVT
jgi:glycosyltransferase involved in cell wall biosynthesis